MGTVTPSLFYIRQLATQRERVGDAAGGSDVSAPGGARTHARGGVNILRRSVTHHDPYSACVGRASVGRRMAGREPRAAAAVAPAGRSHSQAGGDSRGQPPRLVHLRLVRSTCSTLPVSVVIRGGLTHLQRGDWVAAIPPQAQATGVRASGHRLRAHNPKEWWVLAHRTHPRRLSGVGQICWVLVMGSICTRRPRRL